MRDTLLPHKPIRILEHLCGEGISNCLNQTIRSTDAFRIKMHSNLRNMRILAKKSQTSIGFIGNCKHSRFKHQLEILIVSVFGGAATVCDVNMSRPENSNDISSNCSLSRFYLEYFWMWDSLGANCRTWSDRNSVDTTPIWMRTVWMQNAFASSSILSLSLIIPPPIFLYFLLRCSPFLFHSVVDYYFSITNRNYR